MVALLVHTEGFTSWIKKAGAIILLIPGLFTVLNLILQLAMKAWLRVQQDGVAVVNGIALFFSLFFWMLLCSPSALHHPLLASARTSLHHSLVPYWSPRADICCCSEWLRGQMHKEDGLRMPSTAEFFMILS